MKFVSAMVQRRNVAATRDAPRKPKRVKFVGGMVHMESDPLFPV